MKKTIIALLAAVLLFTVTACGSKEEPKKENNKQEEKNETKKEENENPVVVDDEILDIDDEDNTPPGDGRVTVEKVINCDGCVFAYFSGEDEQAKKLGDTVSADEYTNDINNIRTAGNKQRHNFFGLVLSGNTISKAYACILKDSKIYCIQGSTNGAYHTNNIAILNEIFTAGKCRTISDGHTYTCTDGSYNGDTKTSGYTSLHYETSCTIYGANAKTGELICH